MRTRFLKLCALALTLFTTSLAVAEELSIFHDPPAGGDISELGSTITLTAVVKGTRDFSYPGKLFLVRDGRLMEVPLQGTIDTRDRVTYSAEVTVPVAEMSYYFSVFPPDGAPMISSIRYAVRRPCLPSIEFAPPIQTESEEVNANPVRAAHEQAIALQNDITQLEAVIASLDAIKVVLKRGAQ